MTNYSVRVELHRADEDDYTRLHSLMESEGFVRWIETKAGSLKRLPTAEYNMADTTLARAAVLARAKTAANAVKPRPEPWILVTESAGRSWSGLPPWDD
ncbi:hypothetical protein [Bradyrhizobium sp. USDA 4502]